MLGNNKIGNKGCLYLSKARWYNLRRINLGKQDIEYLVGNQIDAEGCSHLSKTYWPELETIDLSK